MRTAHYAPALLLLMATSGLAQQDDTIQLLRELTEAHGPSGYEAPVAKVVRKHLEPLVDRIEIDGLGSMVGSKKGSAASPRIMMVAHMDEVGFIVKHIDDRGFVYMNPLGGWYDGVLLSQRWTILTDKGPVLAISGSKTPHVMRGEERNQLKPKAEVFLDAGAGSRKEATEALGIRPGDPIAPLSSFSRLNDTDLYVAKAWDDRVGIAVMIEALRRLQGVEHPNTVYAVATTQEEVGLRGAGTSVWVVEPDIGLSIEVGVAADYPGIEPSEAQEVVGSSDSSAGCRRSTCGAHSLSSLPQRRLEPQGLRSSGGSGRRAHQEPGCGDRRRDQGLRLLDGGAHR